jgi:hypothetical protein
MALKITRSGTSESAAARGENSRQTPPATTKLQPTRPLKNPKLLSMAEYYSSLDFRVKRVNGRQRQWGFSYIRARR